MIRSPGIALMNKHGLPASFQPRHRWICPFVTGARKNPRPHRGQRFSSLGLPSITWAARWTMVEEAAFALALALAFASREAVAAAVGA